MAMFKGSGRAKAKAVILCAGRSTRTYPLTVHRPKALLLVGGKTIIEHVLDSLAGLASDAIIVVGFGSEQVKAKLGNRYGNIAITYVNQDQALGTGHALLQAEKLIEKDDKFMVMMGDDIYPKESMSECFSYGISMLGQKVDNPSDFGMLETDGGFLTKINEKPFDVASGTANTGFYVLNSRIFDALKRIGRSERGEYELTEAVNELAKTMRIRCFYTKDWMPIVYPWDLLAANRSVLAKMKGRTFGQVEQHVTIKGSVHIGAGTIVHPGTHIEGPAYIGENCIIGPNAYIRPDTCLGSGVRFRGEVVDSIIMNNTTAKHSCYIGHSVVGENVNIAAGTVTADYRHDGEEHATIVNGKKIHTGMKKLGAFIGDNVRTGINTSIYPGRKIWPSLSTKPAEIVDKDMMPHESK
ncbi:MAG: bifunctional sugar-1-phosphate nucleotidylyltransferase/acetyltransferase [Candidatus Aenigmatarchaeota archaeon]